MTTTRDVARRIGPELVELRRRLHRTPELDLALPHTQRTVQDALAGLDLEITTGAALSSVTAVLRGRGGRAGSPPASGPVDPARRPAVLLRGDMDALPVTEKLELPYASQEPGRMHACGHDLHMAGLVGAARILHELRDDLAGDVVLMFQPGEEATGGAPIMIDEGVLDAAGPRVNAAYALHVYSSGYPLGTWFSRSGPQMAACDQLLVTVLGAGGHGSAPHKAADPIPAACEMVLALQTMVTRRFSVFDPVVLTVGTISGGTKENIIGDETRFEATVRTFSAAHRDLMESACLDLVRGIAAAHGLRARVEYHRGYPVTVNDDAEHAFAVQTVADLFGPSAHATMPEPECGSEDFSYVLEQVPGAYLNLSACAAADPDIAPDNHAGDAAFDDSVLPDAAALLAELAIRRLARG
jgi:hippurate hydrolase